MKDFYYILGVNPTASTEEIKRAYRKLSHKFHPDKNNGDNFFAEHFKSINEAYKILCDSSERAAYDALCNKIKQSTNKNKGTANTNADNFPPEIEYFRASKNSFQVNEEITFYWKSINADRVTIKPFGVVKPIGQATYKLKNFERESLSFTLLAENTSIQRIAKSVVVLKNETYAKLYEAFKDKINKQERDKGFSNSATKESANTQNTHQRTHTDYVAEEATHKIPYKWILLILGIVLLIAYIAIRKGNNPSLQTVTSESYGRNAYTLSNDASIETFTLNDGIKTYRLIATGNKLMLQNAVRNFTEETTNLTATVVLGNSNATISPDPATARNYETPVIYTVTAQNGTTKTYSVQIAAYDAMSNPYGIYTEAQLSDINNDLTASYKLMNNIALTGDWTPIGGTENSNTGYTGTFDGNGKVISNLSISGTVNDTSIGLFGIIGTAGNVKNLGINIASAGVVGNNGNGDGVIGGLAGFNQGTISNCYVTGGKVQGDLTGGGGSVGGLVGANYGVITNCYAQTNITGVDIGWLGGIAGINGNGGHIHNCYYAGIVTPNGGTFIGAIAGISGKPATVVSDNYWDSDIITGGIGGVGTNGDGSTATNNVAKTTADMQSQATVDLLNGAQTPKPWKYVAGSYPKLAWEQ